MEQKPGLTSGWLVNFVDAFGRAMAAAGLAPRGGARSAALGAGIMAPYHRMDEERVRQAQALQQSLQQATLDLDRRNIESQIRTREAPAPPTLIDAIDPATGQTVRAPDAAGVVRALPQPEPPPALSNRTIERDGRSIIQYFMPADPGQVIVEQDAGPVRTGNVDPLSAEGIMAQLQLIREREALAGAGAAQGEMSPLAQMAVQDPSVLDGLTPTDYGKLMNEIASAVQRGDTQFLTQAARSNLGLVDEALATIELMEGMGEPGNRPGVGPLIGRVQPLPGESFDYARLLDRLRAQLTLPKLRFLRGLGHMSDREFGSITSSVTHLDRGLRGESFDNEMQSLKEALLSSRRQIVAGAGGGAVNMNDPSINTVPGERMTGADPLGLFQ